LARYFAGCFCAISCRLHGWAYSQLFLWWFCEKSHHGTCESIAEPVIHNSYFINNISLINCFFGWADESADASFHYRRSRVSSGCCAIMEQFTTVTHHADITTSIQAAAEDKTLHDIFRRRMMFIDSNTRCSLCNLFRFV
jgi:hypothetical protein